MGTSLGSEAVPSLSVSDTGKKETICLPAEDRVLLFVEVPNRRRMKAFRFKDKMEGFKDARRVGEAGRDVGVPERAVLHGLVRLVREGRARRKGVLERGPPAS